MLKGKWFKHCNISWRVPDKDNYTAICPKCRMPLGWKITYKVRKLLSLLLLLFLVAGCRPIKAPSKDYASFAGVVIRLSEVEKAEIRAKLGRALQEQIMILRADKAYEALKEEL